MYIEIRYTDKDGISRIRRGIDCHSFNFKDNTIEVYGTLDDWYRQTPSYVLPNVSFVEAFEK